MIWKRFSHSAFTRGCDRHELLGTSQWLTLACIRTYSDAVPLDLRFIPYSTSFHLPGFNNAFHRFPILVRVSHSGLICHVSLFLYLSPMLIGFRLRAYRIVRVIQPTIDSHLSLNLMSPTYILLPHSQLPSYRIHILLLSPQSISLSPPHVSGRITPLKNLKMKLCVSFRKHCLHF